MAILHHYPLAASSRLIRLQCGEYKLSLDLVTQLPWLRDEKLLALNPAGELPVFEDETHGVICGARVISEWIEASAQKCAA
ncbi:MAG: glutathione S-transferase N-terminal domain-containing protein [Alphaproteobacteria bacterium]